MSHPARDRFFEAFGRAGMRRPGLITAILLVLLMVSGWLGQDLELATSRYALVSEEDAYQSRMIRFFKRFGYPDSPLLVVTGGSVEERRAVVDSISEELETNPMFTGRVFGRLGPEAIAEVLLLQEPKALHEVAKSLPEGVNLSTAVEGGVPGLLRGLEAQLMAGLEGDLPVAEGGGEEAAPTAVDAGPKQSDIDEGISRLAKIAKVLDARMSGEDVAAALSELVESDDGQQRPETMPVDDEGYLGSSHGKHLLIALFPEFEDDAMTTYLPVVDELRAIKARHETATVSVLLTGTPVISVDDQTALERGLYQSGLATGAGIFLLLLLAFRSLRAAIVALLPVGLSVGLSVGALMLLYGHLNVVTSSFAAVLMGLGIDLSLHLMSRFHEELRIGTERREAIMIALRSAGPGILVGAFTTALAFVTLMGAQFTAYGELGVLASTGLGISFVVTMLMVPALLNWKLLTPDKAPPPLPGLGGMTSLLGRTSRVLIAVGLTAAALGALSLNKIEFNTRFFDHLPAEFESARALKMLEEDGALDPVFAFVTAESIGSAREMTEKLRSLDTVGAVQSVSDMLPDLSKEHRLEDLRATFETLREPDFEKLRGRERSREELDLSVRDVVDALDEIKFTLEQAGRPTKSVEEAIAAFKELRATVKTLPEDGGTQLANVEGLLAEILGRAWTTAAGVAKRGEYSAQDVPLVFRRRHAANDGSAAVSLYVFPKYSLYDRDAAKAFTDEIETVDPQAAGLALTLHYHMAYLIDDFRKATFIAGVLVFLLLCFDMRSPIDALLAISPALLGWLWMVGIFVATDSPFSAANVGCLPLVLGIGVDAGAHMMHRVRQSAAERGGVADINELLGGTGGAVLLSSTTTMVGFAGLMIADHEGMVSFGLMMVVGIGSTMVASLVVLPSLLLVFGRAK